MAQTSGTWLGYGFSGIHLYRLNLQENGSGTFSLLYDDQDIPTVSRIRWDIQHHAILIKFIASSNQPPVAVARASNRGEYMLLEVKDGSWKDTAWLQRKARVEKQIQLIEGAAGASSDQSH